MELKCMRKLVVQVGVVVPFPMQRQSPAMNAIGDMVFALADIVLRECSWARLESFAAHMTVDSRGLASSIVARKTWFVMEEFKAFDVSQVVAALANVSVRTLLIVGDVHQTVEICSRRGRRVTFNEQGGIDALQFTRYDLENDDEE